MRAEIISIGTELLLGNITDTNATYLTQRLAGIGIDCHYVSQVGDNLERIIRVLQLATFRSDLVVTTGGLGPTNDDLTREAISALLGEAMAVDAELERHLTSLFARRGLRMPESNKKQATLIPSAESIPNPVGTAPGWWVSMPSGTSAPPVEIVSMPGVPFEMKRMWEREVEPRLAALSPFVIASRTLKVMGLGESRVEEVVRDLMNSGNPTLAPYAKNDGIHLRITAKANNREEAARLIAPLEEQVRVRLGDALYGVDDDTPQGVTSVLLDNMGLSFAVLEVGEGAIGSVGALLGAHPLCAGVLGGRDLHAVARVMGQLPMEVSAPTLSASAARLCEYLGSDIAVAVSSSLESLGNDGTSVKYDTEIIVTVRGQAADEAQIKQTWRTSRSEVGRLIGLAALNLVRQRLRSLARAERLGVAR
jgi:nicotinamide-nucleotide amidase